MRSDPQKVQRDQVVPDEIPGMKIENDYKPVQGTAVELEAKEEPMNARKTGTGGAYSYWS